MSDQQDSVSSSFISAIKAGSLKDVTELVLSHGLSCCEGVYGGYALLRDTIESGHFEVAKFLLQQRAMTPLHIATQQNCIERVQSLLDENAPINAGNDQNETALHIAAKEGYVEIVKLLLSNNADATAKTQDGSMPHWLASVHGNAEVYEMLLQYASSNLKQEKDLMPSVSSRKKSTLTVLKHVLTYNPGIYDKVSKLVVHIVILDKGHSQIVDDLIDSGFSLRREYVNESLLFAAMKKHYVQLIKNIVANGPDSKFSKYSPQLLHTAVKSGLIELVELFLNSGLNVSAKNEKGITCLNYVLRSEDEDKCIEIIRLLFAKGAKIEEAPVLLHEAAAKHLVKVCEFLIGNGVNVNALDCLNNTPLYLACDGDDKPNQERAVEIIELFLNSGADVNIAGVDKMTAFHVAALTGMKTLVHFFLNLGVDVNLRAPDNATPLHSASWHAQEEIVEILCLNGADVNARNKNGWTPLHMALLSGCKHNKTGTILMNFGADINARGSENETALHCAAINRVENVESLLMNGCDINAETNRGYTALDTMIIRAKIYGKNWSEEGLFIPDILNGAIEVHDYPYFEPGRYKAIVALIRHLVKLAVAGLYVSERNLHSINTSTYVFFDFEIQCEEEVSRMKNEELYQQVTLYDIVTKGPNPAYARNKVLMDILTRFNLDSFPVYRNIITANLKRSKLKLELLESGMDSLDILVKRSTSFTCIKNKKKCSFCINKSEKCVLPLLISEQVVSCLSDSDLKNLVSSSKALENESSRSFSDIYVAEGPPQKRCRTNSNGELKSK